MYEKGTHFREAVVGKMLKNIQLVSVPGIFNIRPTQTEYFYLSMLLSKDHEWCNSTTYRVRCKVLGLLDGGEH